MYVNTVLALVILATTIAAYTSAESDEEIEERKDRRIVKRDAAVIIDHIPVQQVYRSDTPVIYRRITRRRYTPKPKYGPPKSKYRSVKPRKPYKKTKKPSIKYGPPSRKKRPTKPRYGPPKVNRKPIYGPPKKPSYSYEPDSYWNYEDAPNYEQSYEKPSSFGEPPVEYGAPYASPSNIYTQKYKQHNYDGTNYNGDDNFGVEDESESYNNYSPESDYNFAHTKEKPVYVKPEYIDDYATEDIDPDLLRIIKSTTKPEKRKPYKKQRKPWRPTTTTPSPEEDDEVIVGGQYAEPPGRYVPKFASDPNFDDSDFSPMHFYMNPDRVSTMSSYVNYKNSNMAFSPQNLNDAFSIVEK
ncbi:adhesive plaque matrix protein-like [Aricia agestis]|uniref:adhesive plaque matrix protein-like n=1 Tax=Aricia agestis TaxID=91739 RepID=UPI001C208D01|nr:adhesive plaque matrix protein-like [Aricia agestis]